VADGFAALQAQIDRVRALENLPRAAAPECAYELEDELHRQIGAGVDPDGKPWERRKDTGEQPLQDAAKALGVAAVGTTVFCRVKGPEALHSKGRARGGVVRRILPVSGLPTRYAAAIKRGLTRTFEQTMGVG
jgi:hypothetical protein